MIHQGLASAFLMLALVGTANSQNHPGAPFVSRPIEQLLAEARTAVPPASPRARRSPDLVDLASLDPTLRFDIRYATANNHPQVNPRLCRGDSRCLTIPGVFEGPT